MQNERISCRRDFDHCGGRCYGGSNHDKYGKEGRGCIMKLVIEAAVEVVICIAAILKVIKKK
ncbi:MAG: hypothetical protein UE819_03895 [Ruminococcus sp.]|jgi:hypothetical protein|nr:hypothetical protein [Ruminococcus sp.]